MQTIFYVTVKRIPSVFFVLKKSRVAFNTRFKMTSKDL